jgi:acetyl-CoA C-acetyltransferase
MEMVTMEDLGFCEEGTAWQCIRGKCEEYNGFYEVKDKQVFVNTNGGLKADGNPLGATGGAQVFEVFRQLRGEAGQRQIKNDSELPRYGCTQEFEGFGTKSYVTVLGRD